MTINFCLNEFNILNDLGLFLICYTIHLLITYTHVYSYIVLKFTVLRSSVELSVLDFDQLKVLSCHVVQ